MMGKTLLAPLALIFSLAACGKGGVDRSAVDEAPQTAQSESSGIVADSLTPEAEAAPAETLAETIDRLAKTTSPEKIEELLWGTPFSEYRQVLLKLESSDTVEIECLEPYPVYRAGLSTLVTSAYPDYSELDVESEYIELHDAFDGYDHREIHVFLKAATSAAVTLRNEETGAEFSTDISATIERAKSGFYIIVPVFLNPYNEKRLYAVSVRVDGRTIAGSIYLPAIEKPFLLSTADENPLVFNRIERLETGQDYDIIIPSIGKTLTLYGSSNGILYYPIKTWLCDSFDGSKPYRFRVLDKHGLTSFYFDYGRTSGPEDSLLRSTGVVFPDFY